MDGDGVERVGVQQIAPTSRRTSTNLWEIRIKSCGTEKGTWVGDLLPRVDIGTQLGVQLAVHGHRDGLRVDALRDLIQRL